MRHFWKSGFQCQWLDAEVCMAVVNDGGMTISLVFGRWTLHGDGRLTGEGVDIQLPPKEWQVLRLLLVSGGALMTKDCLLEMAWRKQSGPNRQNLLHFTSFWRIPLPKGRAL